MDNGLFTPQDLEELSARGITPEAAAHQVEEIRKGFPYLEILASASLEQGILRVETSEEARYMDLWEEYLLSGKASVYKMVPASGAASRMFKMLYTSSKLLIQLQISPRKSASSATSISLPSMSTSTRLVSVITGRASQSSSQLGSIRRS